MIFGQSAEFSIEAYHEPSGPEYAGFGRISIEVQGVRLGDILENHCSLFHVVDRFRELIVSIAIQWDERFTGLSDLGIFKFLDQALYLGEESRWESYGKFNFLTNAGESFDGFKTFIVCRPDEQVQILCQSRNGVFGSMCCHMDSFVTVSEAFVRWFDEEVQITSPPYFPVHYIAARASRADDAAFLEAISHIPNTPVVEDWDKMP